MQHLTWDSVSSLRSVSSLFNYVSLNDCVDFSLILELIVVSASRNLPTETGNYAKDVQFRYENLPEISCTE